MSTGGDERLVQVVDDLPEIGVVAAQDVGLPFQEAHDARRDVFHHRQ